MGPKHVPARRARHHICRLTLEFTLLLGVAITRPRHRTLRIAEGGVIGGLRINDSVDGLCDSSSSCSPQRFVCMMVVCHCSVLVDVNAITSHLYCIETS